MKERNRAIDILKIIAIILVVLGHTHSIPGATWLEYHFPIYSYHMALFLFASGYLFKDIEWRDFGRYVWRKTTTLALPLIGWNFVYAAILTLINLRHPANYLPPTAQIWNLHDLFVEPFIGGHQYILNLATWFVGMLYLTLLVFALFHLLSKRLPDWSILLVYLCLAFFALYSATLQLPGRGFLVLERIAYALFFVQLGRCFRIYIEPHLQTKYIVCLLPIVFVAWYLVMLNGNHLYVLAWMNFEGAIVRPVLGALFACLFWMLVCILFAKLIPANKTETTLSLSTWSIMTHHLLVRFLFCWAFVHFFPNPAMREWFANDFWFFPQGIGLYIAAVLLEIGLPCLWQIVFDSIKNQLTRISLCISCLLRRSCPQSS
jgi:fucose 4-O-acetylase-like acetyltransferase